MEIARILQIYRYPVKSMAGESINSGVVGWHGLMGDRRLALLRKGVTSGFPWLTASKLPQLITYTPIRLDQNQHSDLPTHIRTPSGAELELRGDALQKELSEAHGAPLEIMQLDQGIFDEAQISIISTATIKAIEEEAGLALDVRRFRPNILVETENGRPFEEEEWLGRAVQIGTGDQVAKVHIYLPDIRCAMLNIDPVSGDIDPRVLKAAVHLNNNLAGVYAKVIDIGTISVADKLFLVN